MRGTLAVGPYHVHTLYCAVCKLTLLFDMGNKVRRIKQKQRQKKVIYLVYYHDEWFFHDQSEITQEESAGYWPLLDLHKINGELKIFF